MPMWEQMRIDLEYVGNLDSEDQIIREGAYLIGAKKMIYA